MGSFLLIVGLVSGSIAVLSFTGAARETIIIVRKFT